MSVHAVGAKVTAVVDRALAFHKNDGWPDMESIRAAFVAAMTRVE